MTEDTLETRMLNKFDEHAYEVRSLISTINAQIAEIRYELSRFQLVGAGNNEKKSDT